MVQLPYIVALVAYAFVSVAHLLPGALGRHERLVWPAGLLGAAVHGVTLLVVVTQAEAPGFPDALSAMSLSMAGAWLWVGRGRLGSLGMFLGPLALVVLATALVVPHRQVQALDSVGPSAWAPLHLGLMVAGLAGFTLCFAVGLTYLYVRRRLKQRNLSGLARLPALETLDRIQFRAMLFGFVFLTLGIGTGGAWASASALDQAWVVDPKVWFTLVVWCWYGLALQVRLVAGWRGRWSALFGIVGFAGMGFSLLVLNFVVTGFHAYGP